MGRWFEENLFGPAGSTRGDRWVFRAFEAYVAFASAQLAWGWAEEIQRIGHIVLRLGVAQYIDPSFLHGSPAAYVVAAVITALLIVALTGVWRFAYLGAFVLLHFQFSARYVLGEIPHSANLIGMALLGLALANLRFSQRDAVRRLSIGFIVFFTGLGYTSAAICKFVATGLSWPAGRHLILWIGEKQTDSFSKFGVLEPTFLQDMAVSNEWVATLFLLVGLVSEALAFTLWSRKLRPFAALAILGLHFGIFGTMGILFLKSIILVTIFGLPWAWLINKWWPEPAQGVPSKAGSSPSS